MRNGGMMNASRVPCPTLAVGILPLGDSSDDEPSFSTQAWSVHPSFVRGSGMQPSLQVFELDAMIFGGLKANQPWFDASTSHAGLGWPQSAPPTDHPDAMTRSPSVSSLRCCVWRSPPAGWSSKERADHHADLGPLPG